MKFHLVNCYTYTPYRDVKPFAIKRQREQDKETMFSFA